VLEARIPGPDVSPYLVLAAIIYGAARGIREAWTPPPPVVSDPIAAGGYTLLPRTLEDSVVALRSSAVAKDLLGTEFIEHFTAMKLDEAQAYDDWRKKHPEARVDRVTDWELSNYFEWA
jgi:glutamine synthetase